ncbi:probable cytochrome P450 304a1 [Contarinia nasturtii]|uniref:probable cytochrome P450 304a1 n=1 Tax=Contarinia nasturtii TaxID=265458 RepID=UPI0012D4468A|nr:probable cytochrome P450 304a1 [Contarinia nasturtii]
MVSLILVGIWIALAIFQIYKWMFHRPNNNFPPGPPRLPILGAYPYLLLLNYKHVHKAVDWMCWYYKTDVLGLYAAQFPTIVANTSTTAKECLNNQALDGKPALKLAQLRDPDFEVRGIFFTEGPLWHEQRRFALRNLRDFGFGRRQDELELELHDEILNLLDLIKNGPKYDFEKNFHDGDSVLVPNIFPSTLGNFFMKVFLNERLPREKMHILYKAFLNGSQFGKKGDDWGRMFSYNEWIPKLFPKFSEYNLLRETQMKYYNCMKEIIDEQHRTYDRNHERNFLDIYFKKMEDNKDNPKSSHTYQQLILLTADLFLPALLANAIQTQFLLQRFYLQPEILKKCQNEIDTVVGNSRLPTLNDRQNLPYVEATIRESLRHETLIPSGLPHTAMADTKFRGYDIPKGTIVFSSLHASHVNDKETWKNPDQFQPERFLDESGQFSPKLDKSMPFGAGKRICAGETFARNTLFLLVSALVQNFNIILPANGRMPLPCETLSGVFRYAPEFRLKFVSR